MTAYEIVNDVANKLGVSREIKEDAVLFAMMTATNHHVNQKRNLTKDEAHIVRMYFRTLLHRLMDDAEYRSELRKEIERRVERN